MNKKIIAGSIVAGALFMGFGVGVYSLADSYWEGHQSILNINKNLDTLASRIKEKDAKITALNTKLEQAKQEADSATTSINDLKAKFTDATLNSSINRADFDKYYLDAISAKQILWPLFDVLDSKDADGILPSLLRSEETALSRPHLQFLAVQLLALLKGDLSRWPDVHQLSRFSNGATLRENLSESAVNSNSDLWTQVLLIFDNCTQSR